MKTIVNSSSKIKKIIPRNKILGKSRLNTYIIILSVDEGYLLFNVLLRKLILLNESEFNFLKETISNGNNAKRENSKDFEELYSNLVDDYFLVSSEYDENKIVNQLRHIFSMVEKKKEISSYTILPTTNCNARCFYCYENNYVHETLSEETINKIIKFMGDNCPSKSVTIRWFGGEPLVGYKQIDRIIDLLIENQFEVKSTMITNGYLFSPELIKIAKNKWHLYFVQITIDGTKDIYNQTKAYINADKNPYEKVLSNIECLLKENIRVSVRMNMDMHNASDLEDLIIELSTRFSKYSNFGAYIHLLFDGLGYAPLPRDSQIIDTLWQTKRKLDDLLRDKGVGAVSQLPEFKVNQCMADTNNCVLITPDGGLAKCEHDAYQSRIGNLDTGITDNTMIKKWEKCTPWEQCKNCPANPVCYHLDNCFSQKSGCSDYQKAERLLDIKSSMTNTYLYWLKHEKISSDEYVMKTEC